MHRLCQDVGVIVADQLESISLVARGDQSELRIAVERAGDIEQLAVDARAECGLGKAGADRGGDFCRGRAGRNLTHGTIGQGDLEQFGHGVPLGPQPLAGAARAVHRGNSAVAAVPARACGLAIAAGAGA